MSFAIELVLAMTSLQFLDFSSTRFTGFSGFIWTISLVEEMLEDALFAGLLDESLVLLGKCCFDGFGAWENNTESVSFLRNSKDILGRDKYSKESNLNVKD